MVLLDGVILTGRLCEFINEFIKIHNDDLEDKTWWELWLHKCFTDMSFANFMKTVKPESGSTGVLSNDEIERTIQDSKGIISSFCLS